MRVSTVGRPGASWGTEMVTGSTQLLILAIWASDSFATAAGSG